jgi:hypothetical protein
VITALTSNEMIAPSIWIDPRYGNDYFLTAQYSENNIDSVETLRNIPVRSADNSRSRDDALLLRDVATIVREKPPAETDHYSNFAGGHERLRFSTERCKSRPTFTISEASRWLKQNSFQSPRSVHGRARNGS